MKKNLWLLPAFLLFIASGIQAQNKLSIDKVYSTYLRNSGTIMESNQIKGYFFLYISDKIDRRTNEYTLQILDQNLNKVRDIKFQDSKHLNLLEAAYNGNSLSFHWVVFEQVSVLQVIVVADTVIMEFNEKYKLTGATIYE